MTGTCKSAHELQPGDRVYGREVEEVDIHANGTVTVYYAEDDYPVCRPGAETLRRLELVPVE